MEKFKKIGILILIGITLGLSTYSADKNVHRPMLPLLPLNPDGTPTHDPVGKLPQDELPVIKPSGTDSNLGLLRPIEKVDTLMLGAKADIYVPLEIISDVEIEATLVDDQEIDIPFNLELNKKPDQNNRYRVKFSEQQIDIDSDGVTDTYIYTPEFINTQILEGNYVKVKGSGISKEGTFYKKIYITIEVD